MLNLTSQRRNEVVLANSGGGEPGTAGVSAVLRVLHGTEDWNVIVATLHRAFKLPSNTRVYVSSCKFTHLSRADMKTRNGLKHVHADFGRIQAQLVAVYDEYRGDDKVMGGIVGIWARMADDAILRTRLVRAGWSSLCPHLR